MQRRHRVNSFVEESAGSDREDPVPVRDHDIQGYTTVDYFKEPVDVGPPPLDLARDVIDGLRTDDILRVDGYPEQGRHLVEFGFAEETRAKVGPWRDPPPKGYAAWNRDDLVREATRRRVENLAFMSAAEIAHALEVSDAARKR